MTFTPSRRVSTRALLLVLAILAAAAAVLYAMGRLPICECGKVKLWVGEADGPDNSQHVADWYTLSHVIHGFLFYGGLRLIARRWSMGSRLVAATLIEAAWEILENTPMVIDRYRAATMALGYTGDSILNSVSDILFMMLGFFLAARLPVRVTVLLAVVFELLALAVIRDNLTLNVVMLLWPQDWIRQWQAGG
ncbi:DUF2585 domain-containing protein [Neomegalonema sp.]|uniref:DUF2585 domain-containing protein n=1 Tax=Neomegalonema sp. TaxID=2039713 RepID=UPI002612D0AE|nr:DUF2585 domain-containing protein [Neomegalonema sp.]MDD2869563.1 DUF2585 domain-containing protein [Neomegalonema sp.]